MRKEYEITTNWEKLVQCEVCRFVLLWFTLMLFGLPPQFSDVWSILVLSGLLYRRNYQEFLVLLNVCEPAIAMMILSSPLYLLDWNAWWQQWPIPTLTSACIGFGLDIIVRAFNKCDSQIW